MDIFFKAPILGFYCVLIPLLWLFAFNALNYIFIAEEWLEKLLYFFFFFLEVSCSFAMIYALYKVFFVEA